MSYAVEGVVAGLPVATPDGWRLAGTLRQGDPVVTLGGTAPLRGVFRATLGAGMARALWPLAVPQGALGNPVALLLPADQRVALGADGGMMLLPARALCHWRGIAPVRPAGQVVVALHFDAPQVVVAAGMLFGCAGDYARGAGGTLAPGLPEAREIVACRIAFDAGRALGQAARAKRR